MIVYQLGNAYDFDRQKRIDQHLPQWSARMTVTVTGRALPWNFIPT